MAVTTRKSATERRDEILEAALVEFAARGLDGGSTETIAKAVGISQPYVFRLFGTKKQLFIATVERCLRGTLEMMHTASDRKSVVRERGESGGGAGDVKKKQISR